MRQHIECSRNHHVMSKECEKVQRLGQSIFTNCRTGRAGGGVDSGKGDKKKRLCFLSLLRQSSHLSPQALVRAQPRAETELT